jgi:PhoPQ-activated pathogenicity-related protein
LAKERRRRRMGRICAVVALLCAMGFSPAWGGLMEYVKKDDGSFGFTKRIQLPISPDVTGYELELVSQKWRDMVWKHRLRIAKPENLKESSMALLFITGSGGGMEELKYTAEISRRCGVLGAVLHDVPNQPLFGGMVEDQIISYTFDEFYQTGDEEWPLLLPMAKSAVKAMDAIEQFASKELKVKVTGFVVMGASKRGWTTWLSAIVDPRVKAIIPMVYDNLNLRAQMRHQIETWGKYSEQIHDYTERGLQEKMDTDRGIRLEQIVDPYSYRDKLTVPKLIINGTKDRYWTLDALNLYWDGLPGEKYVLYVPNSGHGLEDRERVLKDIAAFIKRAKGELKFPNMRWEIKEEADRIRLSVSSDIKPKSVRIWSTTSQTKDFRDSRWTSMEIMGGKDGYVGEVHKPPTGYVACFAEAAYEVGGFEFFLSTNIKIAGR